MLAHRPRWRLSPEPINKVPNARRNAAPLLTSSVLNGSTLLKWCRDWLAKRQAEEHDFNVDRIFLE
jgi:hypothetical protein